jgi:hypothetical protein
MWWILSIVGALLIVAWLIIFLLKLSRTLQIVGWVLLGLGIILVILGIVLSLVRRKPYNPDFCYQVEEGRIAAVKGQTLYGKGYTRDVLEGIRDYSAGKPAVFKRCPCLPSYADIKQRISNEKANIVTKSFCMRE